VTTSGNSDELASFAFCKGRTDVRSCPAIALPRTRPGAGFLLAEPDSVFFLVVGVGQPKSSRRRLSRHSLTHISGASWQVGEEHRSAQTANAI